MLKVIFLFFSLVMFLLSTAFSQDTIIEMSKARSRLSNSLQLVVTEEMNVELGDIELKFREILLSQLSFCKKTIVELNSYFIKEIEGEVDVKKLKENCLLSLRKWHINTEKKLFKLKRLELKKVVEKSLAKLRAMEEEQIKKVVESYKDLI